MKKSEVNKLREDIEYLKWFSAFQLGISITMVIVFFIVL